MSARRFRADVATTRAKLGNSREPQPDGGPRIGPLAEVPGADSGKRAPIRSRIATLRMSLREADCDPVVFGDPEDFDPDRRQLDESLVFHDGPRPR